MQGEETDEPRDRRYVHVLREKGTMRPFSISGSSLARGKSAWRSQNESIDLITAAKRSSSRAWDIASRDGRRLEQILLRRAGGENYHRVFAARGRPDLGEHLRPSLRGG